MPDVADSAERFAKFANLTDARHGLTGKVLRFGTGSIVAVVCSQTTFLLLYGPLDASTTASSVCAWLAGAVPNYWINRSWTWGQRGRPSLRRELLPYAAIILGTLVLAIVATASVAAVLDGTSVSDGAQTLLVSGTYFLVYALMFVFRFVLFDRLFATQGTQGTQETHANG
jgi:putative flippase GtrA